MPEGINTQLEGGGLAPGRLRLCQYYKAYHLPKGVIVTLLPPLDGGTVFDGRPPSLCLKCGAVANPFCKRDLEAGVWVCSICNTSNTAYYSAKDLEEEHVPEFVEKELEYHTPLPQEHTDAVSSTVHRAPGGLVLVLDKHMGSREEADGVIHALETVLSDGSIPPETHISLLVFGRAVSVYRVGLFGGEGLAPECMAADTIDGSAQLRAPVIELIASGFKGGVYTIPLHAGKQHLIYAIRAMVTDGTFEYGPSAEAGSAGGSCLGAAMEVVLNGARAGSQVVAVATRRPSAPPEPSLPLGIGPVLASVQGDEGAQRRRYMGRLGKSLGERGVRVHVLCVGLTSYFDIPSLHELAFPTGGDVLLYPVTSINAANNNIGQLKEDLRKMLCPAGAGTLGVADIRMSDHMDIVATLGPHIIASVHSPQRSDPPIAPPSIAESLLSGEWLFGSGPRSWSLSRGGSLSGGDGSMEGGGDGDGGGDVRERYMRAPPGEDVSLEDGWRRLQQKEASDGSPPTRQRPPYWPTMRRVVLARLPPSLLHAHTPHTGTDRPASAPPDATVHAEEGVLGSGDRACEGEGVDPCAQKVQGTRHGDNVQDDKEDEEGQPASQQRQQQQQQHVDGSIAGGGGGAVELTVLYDVHDSIFGRLGGGRPDTFVLQCVFRYLMDHGRTVVTRVITEQVHSKMTSMEHSALPVVTAKKAVLATYTSPGDASVAESSRRAAVEEMLSLYPSKHHYARAKDSFARPCQPELRVAFEQLYHAQRGPLLGNMRISDDARHVARRLFLGMSCEDAARTLCPTMLMAGPLGRQEGCDDSAGGGGGGGGGACRVSRTASSHRGTEGLLCDRTPEGLRVWPCESMCMWPYVVLALDAHDRIVIWVGREVAMHLSAEERTNLGKGTSEAGEGSVHVSDKDAPSNERLQQHAHAMLSACRGYAQRVRASRFPTPQVLEIMDGHPLARYMLSRVNPSHKDAPDTFRERFPDLVDLLEADAKQLRTTLAGLTADDPSLDQYLSTRRQALGVKT